MTITLSDDSLLHSMHNTIPVTLNEHIENLSPVLDSNIPITISYIGLDKERNRVYDVYGTRITINQIVNGVQYWFKPPYVLR